MTKYSMVSVSAVACTVLVGVVLTGCSDNDTASASPGSGGGNGSSDTAEPGALNGKDGTNGKNRTDGKDGTDGVNGKDGTDGNDGKDGVNGEAGKDAPVIGPVALFISSPKIITSATTATFAFGCSEGNVLPKIPRRSAVSAKLYPTTSLARGNTGIDVGRVGLMVTECVEEH